MKKARLEVFPATAEGFSQLLGHCRLSDDLWRSTRGKSLFQSILERIDSNEPIWDMYLSGKSWKSTVNVLFIRGSICVLSQYRRNSKICQVREYQQYSGKHLLPFIDHIPYFIQAGWEPHSWSVESVYLIKEDKILEFYGYHNDVKIWLLDKFRSLAHLVYSSYYKTPLPPPAELLAAIESGNQPPKQKLTGKFPKFDLNGALDNLAKKEES